jgi:hypothetical protein
MRTRLAAVVGLAVLMAIAALLAPSASAESSSSAFGGRLVTLINQARAQHGLKALTVTSGTSTVATSWTQHLDQQQALSHNPDLGHQLETHGSPNWTAYGENVGDGPTSSADTLFQAYMNSPEHRANILGSAYRYLGIGVVFDGSTAWNTLDFVDQYSTPKPRTTTTQPAPSTTKTTTRTAPKTAPKVVTRTAPRPAPRPAVRAQRVAPRPAARVHSVSSRPTVKAIAAVLPPAPVVQVPVMRAAVALPMPVKVPARDSLPIVVAAAMILLVVATRYAAEVLPRRA